MDVKISTVENKVKKSLEKLTQKVMLGRAFIEQEAYPKYLEHQMLRWGSQNWGSWPALNPKYEEYKKRKFAQFPGQGQRMMIATGKLIDAVLGKNEFHVRIITEHELIVGIQTRSKDQLGYARRANELRPFMDFKSSVDKNFIKALKTRYQKYLRGEL